MDKEELKKLLLETFRDFSKDAMRRNGTAAASRVHVGGDASKLVERSLRQLEKDSKSFSDTLTSTVKNLRPFNRAIDSLVADLQDSLDDFTKDTHDVLKKAASGTFDLIKKHGSGSADIIRNASASLSRLQELTDEIGKTNKLTVKTAQELEEAINSIINLEKDNLHVLTDAQKEYIDAMRPYLKMAKDTNTELQLIKDAPEAFKNFGKSTSNLHTAIGATVGGFSRLNAATGTFGKVIQGIATGASARNVFQEVLSVTATGAPEGYSSFIDAIRSGIAPSVQREAGLQYSQEVKLLTREGTAFDFEGRRGIQSITNELINQANKLGLVGEDALRFSLDATRTLVTIGAQASDLTRKGGFIDLAADVRNFLNIPLEEFSDIVDSISKSSDFLIRYGDVAGEDLLDTLGAEIKDRAQLSRLMGFEADHLLKMQQQRRIGDVSGFIRADIFSGIFIDQIQEQFKELFGADLDISPEQRGLVSRFAATQSRAGMSPAQVRELDLAQTALSAAIVATRSELDKRFRSGEFGGQIEHRALTERFGAIAGLTPSGEEEVKFLQAVQRLEEINKKPLSPADIQAIYTQLRDDPKNVPQIYKDLGFTLDSIKDVTGAIEPNALEDGILKIGQTLSGIAASPFFPSTSALLTTIAANTGVSAFGGIGGIGGKSARAFGVLGRLGGVGLAVGVGGIIGTEIGTAISEMADKFQNKPIDELSNVEIAIGGFGAAIEKVMFGLADFDRDFQTGRISETVAETGRITERQVQEFARQTYGVSRLTGGFGQNANFIKELLESEEQARETLALIAAPRNRINIINALQAKGVQIDQSRMAADVESKIQEISENPELYDPATGNLRADIKLLSEIRELLKDGNEIEEEKIKKSDLHTQQSARASKLREKMAAERQFQLDRQLGDIEFSSTV